MASSGRTRARVHGDDRASRHSYRQRHQIFDVSRSSESIAFAVDAIRSESRDKKERVEVVTKVHQQNSPATRLTACSPARAGPPAAAAEPIGNLPVDVLGDLRTVDAAHRALAHQALRS